MKKFILFAFIAISFTASATKYYLDPAGNDGNTGTIISPWWTLNKAWTVIAPGDTIYMRGGTYTYTTQVYLTGKNGTVTDSIKILNYPGEVPILTKSLVSYTVLSPTPRPGCFISGRYLKVKGLHITGFSQIDTWVSSGLWGLDVRNCLFENLRLYQNGGGLYIQGYSTDNVVLNCDSYENYDPLSTSPYGNADGFNFAYISYPNSTNTRIGCRAWRNSDDNFDDSQNPGFVNSINCWSIEPSILPNGTVSGGNASGFKPGPPGDGAGGQPSHSGENLRRFYGCISTNAVYAWHTNNSDCIMTFENCIAVKSVFGFFINYGNQADVYKNCMAVHNTYQKFTNNNSTAQSCYADGSYANDPPNGGTQWTTGTITLGDFEDTLMAALKTTPRNADSSLPDVDFYKLVTGSNLINAGVDVGQPYSGSAPDVSYKEFNEGGNIIPVANAGADTTITLPSYTCNLNGSGTDADGTITSYLWEKIEGGSASITNANIASTTVTALQAGRYLFRLTVTDNNGGTSIAYKYVTVNPAPGVDASRWVIIGN